MARVYISIGSNVNRAANIRACLHDLEQQFGSLLTSSIYENKAVGFEGDDFYNLVAAFDTDLDVRDLPPLFHQIEDRHGRVRNVPKFSPRTLDIDLLLYDDLVIKDGQIDLPRDEITRYAFVLRPLNDIAPGLEHPQLHQTMTELWQAFEPKQDMRVVKLD